MHWISSISLFVLIIVVGLCQSQSNSTMETVVLHSTTNSSSTIAIVNGTVVGKTIVNSGTISSEIGLLLCLVVVCDLFFLLPR